MLQCNLQHERFTEDTGRRIGRFVATRRCRDAGPEIRNLVSFEISQKGGSPAGELVVGYGGHTQSNARFIRAIRSSCALPGAEFRLLLLGFFLFAFRFVAACHVCSMPQHLQYAMEA